MNRLEVSGVVCAEPERSQTPAGIPITRFTLEHRSQQVEAGMKRETGFRIRVVVAGKEAQQGTVQLETGSMIRVAGFLSRSSHKSGEYRLALHADEIELIK